MGEPWIPWITQLAILIAVVKGAIALGAKDRVQQIQIDEGAGDLKAFKAESRADLRSLRDEVGRHGERLASLESWRQSMQRGRA